MKNVFFIGARGYTKKYGGWEALVHGLVDNWRCADIHFYVFEIVGSLTEEAVFEIDGITCIRLYIKNIGSATMMVFDKSATEYAERYVKDNHIENPILYFLGLRIGPIIFMWRKRLKKHGFVLIENPAGVEWKRTKWNVLVQIYAYIASYLMAKSVDYLLCDAKGILDIYNKRIKHGRPEKLYIPYGSYDAPEIPDAMPEIVAKYFAKHSIIPQNYYLIVNRFVPENSYEMILYEFIKSKTKKELVIVSNIDMEKSFYENLKRKVPFENDKRIRFVGTTYEPEILNYLRKRAFGYINGHTLGGTNPGLLEALATTNLVLVRDCTFSREVAADTAFYYGINKPLSIVLNDCEHLDIEVIEDLGKKAKKRMHDYYSWDMVVSEYEKLFRKL